MKRNIIILAVCATALISGFPVFAAGSSEYATEGNALWYKAADIVDASASVLPVKKTVVWEDLSPSGDTISKDELVIFYSEDKDYIFSGTTGELLSGQKLGIDFAGDSAVLSKRSAVNDGLLWTPFDDDIDDADVKVVNTGSVENLSGTECSIFEYTLYRDAAQYGYNFEEAIADSDFLNKNYKDPESNICIKTTGRAWIDGKGILRQLETVTSSGNAEYCEVVLYDYDGKALYPVASVIEGTLNLTENDLIVQNNFRVTEKMSGYWKASNFYR